MWAMRRVSLTPASCFPPGSRQPCRRGDFSFILAPRPNTRAHARAHTISPFFRGVTRRWRQYSSAQFPILKKILFKRPRYFFVIPHATGRRGGSGAISFATRTAHLHMTIVCTVGESDGPDRPFRLIYPRTCLIHRLAKLQYFASK